MRDGHALDVWLDARCVGKLEERRSASVSLTYTAEAGDRYPMDAPILSVSLPMRTERYSNREVMPFLEGLLPEGEARTALERRYGVPRGNVFRMLEAIGRDCAGAVAFCRPDDEPPAVWSRPDGKPLDEVALQRALQDLPEHPFGDDGEVRISLAGLQDKLVLTRDASTGNWLKPTGGTPSTHILKPEPDGLPGLVANEALCLRVARALGLTSIEVDQLEVANVPVLVVSRYDRRINADGAIRRVHQEDLCQALAVDIRANADAKYEAHGGPTLRAVATLLDQYSDDSPRDLDRLIQATTLNVVIGNADAHGKNLSVLHNGDGTVRLAPLYDLASTISFATVPGRLGPRPVATEPAMSIGGVRDVNAVQVADLERESAAWPGYPGRRGSRVIAEVLERLPDALDDALDSTAVADAELAARVRQRVQRLVDGRPAGVG